ncbi:MAG: hypothetical protein E6H77_09935 [Betaproteobacteria bacterium]|nr:MAG: hypothetical protein E6H77_09935 [Betaproteobacteria bacterium]
MRGAWIATAALVLVACTPMQWVRQDVTPEQAIADEELCRQAAWQEANFRTLGYGPFGPWLHRDVFGRPLFYPPGGAFFDPYMARSFDESRLWDFCMRSKGYQLQPAPK